MLDGLMQGANCDLVKIWQKMNAPRFDNIMLKTVGRTPNGKKIAAEKAGVSVTESGFINVDIQMRTNVPHIFAIGDIVGETELANVAEQYGSCFLVSRRHK